MNNYLIDEKKLIENSIREIALSDRERGRALESLATADVLVGAFFSAWKLLNSGSKPVVARPRLKAQ